VIDQMPDPALLLYAVAGLTSLAAAAQWLRSYLRAGEHAGKSRWLGAIVLTAAAAAAFTAAFTLSVVDRYASIRHAQVNCC